MKTFKTIKFILATTITIFGIVMLVSGFKTMLPHVFLMAVLSFILAYACMAGEEDII